MQQFFVKPSDVKENKILMQGPDVNHIKNVLRIRPGEDLRVSDGEGHSWLCCVDHYGEKTAVLDILKSLDQDTELPSELWLFQGLPKGDKMELIVQKAVELGAYRVVPFAAKRSVVRLDEKKGQKKGPIYHFEMSDHQRKEADVTFFAQNSSPRFLHAT